MRLLLLAFVVVGPAALVEPASVCSSSVFAPLQRSGEVYLLGTVQGETVKVPLAAPPQYLGTVASPEAEAATDSSRVGWVVRVEQSSGSEAMEFTRGAAEVILVPWGYGADCRPLHWREDDAWLDAEQRGVISAYVRPGSAMIDGRPILDVFLAWHQPYPGGTFLAHEFRRSGAPDAEWLKVEEYWSLIQALPTEEQVRTAPYESKASLRLWAQTHSNLVQRFPANLILEMARVIP
jgi:hypothetical protein